MSQPVAPGKRWNWRRLDTLFLRLFILMWVALAGSHLVAYLTVTQLRHPQDLSTTLSRLPPLASLPPGNPLTGAGVPGGPPRPGGPGANPWPGPPPMGGERMPPPSLQPPGGTAAGSDGRPPNPFTAGNPPRMGGPMPVNSLWMDYGIRFVLIGLAAFLGARWLSRPMLRLSRAASALSQDIDKGGKPPVLDETLGTVEVRNAAQVFNQMSQRLKEQFDARGLHMAAVSHDLRTPLTRLRMRVAQWPEGPAQQAAIGDIREMDEMIGDTLAVLREQHEGSQARSIDLVALLQALVDDLADQGQPVQLQAPVGSAPVRVRARTAALRRVIGNLVGNAVRHGGGATLSVHALPEGAVLHIDDSGPGIPEAQLEQALEPWVRLSQDPLPAHAMAGELPAHTAGYGLGLAIARDLAERDGCRLSLHNRPEGGLRAQLVIPLAG
ncbi:ATP-binding protein [Acidovorax sp. LjRoot66]|uniref:ATP-binding protein n=1 Tax=Acidovorax sp. LjRoot66 TaxID=3342334 RepID=UPI003ECFEFBC